MRGYGFGGAGFRVEAVGLRFRLEGLGLRV